VSAPHRLEIGDWVSVGPRSIIQCDGLIGDFTLIGMAVQIVTRDDHAIDELGVPIRNSTWAADRKASPRDAVEIGRDVWVGGASVILSGITIGAGAIVGAGSVVTRDVPSYTIVAGNPARHVRPRFSPEDAERHSLGLDRLTDELVLR
jgi:acetyltransferase-like isoleucine patch superfamily enzyme